MSVWNLLVGWGDKGKLPKYDIIISSAMKFLAGVVSKDYHKAVFSVSLSLLWLSLLCCHRLDQRR